MATAAVQWVAGTGALFVIVANESELVGACSIVSLAVAKAAGYQVDGGSWDSTMKGIVGRMRCYRRTIG